MADKSAGRSTLHPTVPDWYWNRVNNITSTTPRSHVVLHGAGTPIGYAGLEEVGVPLAVTLLVVVVLCVIIAYVKAVRRRRAAQAQRTQHGRSPLDAMAGGAPMSVGAYMNYGPRLANRQNGQRPSTQQVDNRPGPYYITDAPPSYEDAIRHADSGYSSGLLNMGYAASQASITGASDLGQLPGCPPAYAVEEPEVLVPRPVIIVPGSVTTEPVQSAVNESHESSTNSQTVPIGEDCEENKLKNEVDVVRDASDLVRTPKPSTNADEQQQGASEEEIRRSSEVNEGEDCQSPVPGVSHMTLTPECPEHESHND